MRLQRAPEDGDVQVMFQGWDRRTCWAGFSRTSLDQLQAPPVFLKNLNSPEHPRRWRLCGVCFCVPLPRCRLILDFLLISACQPDFGSRLIPQTWRDFPGSKLHELNLFIENMDVGLHVKGTLTEHFTTAASSKQLMEADKTTCVQAPAHELHGTSLGVCVGVCVFAWSAAFSNKTRVEIHT